MLIKYCGGRTVYTISPNRKSYHFNKDNDRTLDIKEQDIINYIFSLPNRNEFTVIEQPMVEKKESLSEKIVDSLKKKAGRPKKWGK